MFSFLFQHQLGEAGLMTGINLNVHVDCLETDENGQVKWVTKIFGIKVLAHIVLHYCNSVVCSRKTNKQGGTIWTEHFDPHLHDIDESVSFV